MLCMCKVNLNFVLSDTGCLAVNTELAYSWSGSRIVLLGVQIWDWLRRDNLRGSAVMFPRKKAP